MVFYPRAMYAKRELGILAIVPLNLSKDSKLQLLHGVV